MEEFKKQYTRLNKSQREAVDQTEGPLLIIAGPGTGKTQLLTLRAANILFNSEQTSAEPYNILCLTFTDTAAHEMRERLINLIGQKAYNITINTYHGFGQEIIRRFPEYFDEIADYRAIDDLGQHEIISDIIAHLPYDNPYKKSQRYIKDVISTIGSLKQALLTPEDVRDIANDNQKFYQEADKLVKSCLAGVERMSKKNLANFESLLTKSARLLKKDRVKIARHISSTWLETLEKALEEATEQNSTTPVTNWKNNWLAKDAHNQFTIQYIEKDRLKPLSDIYQTYQNALNIGQLIDFSDMILMVIEKLEIKPELKFTLQEQYSYIMLDEFQDTNESQLRLVKLLSDNPVHEGRPNVMAVGDDDQAIYAFQGADYSHMLKFMKMYSDVKTVTLSENYRSHPDILHTADNIATQIEERLHGKIKQVNKQLVAANRKMSSEVTIERHELKSDLAQYAWITKSIQGLIKKGVSPNEIAVLSPKHKHIEPLLPYLKKASIPVHYEKRENILENQNINQLLKIGHLIRALGDNDHKLADSLWPEILSYDFWGIPTEEIWKLSWQAYDSRKHWNNLMVQNPSLKNIALFMTKLANLSKNETLESMLDYIIGIEPLKLSSNLSYACPFYKFYFSKDAASKNLPKFWELLSNLTVLRQHLRDYKISDQKYTTLEDLLNFADKNSAANIKILNTNPHHESDQAVQLMTPYKAKGMEFEYVFIMDAIDSVWGDSSKSNSSKVALPPNLAFIRYQGQTNDERLRLLFVAITRAKKGLFISSYLYNFANKATTRLKFLDEVEEDGKAITKVLPKKHQKIHVSQALIPSIDDMSVYWHDRHVKQETIKDLRSLLKDRLARYKMAPTHLNKFIDLEYGGPEVFALETILRFPKKASLGAMFGDVVHESIKWLHDELVRKGRLPTRQAFMANFNNKLKLKEISDHDFGLLQKRGVKCLDNFYRQEAKFLKKTDMHEVNFSDEGILVGNAQISGKIDRLIINETKKEITIVDYKTGESFDKWTSNIKLHKYKQQLYMYKLLVEGSYRFNSFRVVGARLDFLEAKNGVKKLDVPLNMDELIATKKLIEAVYKHIKELAIPDVSPYPVSIRGVKEFEKDLIEGKV